MKVGIRKQRCELEIMKEIIEAIINGRVIRSHIMGYARLTYDTSKEYLDYMIKAGVLKCEISVLESTRGNDIECNRYSLTEKSYQYLDIYNQLLEMFKQ